MRFLTDRKRAVGLGSAKTGVHHFWAMKVQSVALLILIPLFVFTFGGIWAVRSRRSRPITRGPSRPSSWR